jgi:hypothetical protein
MVSAHRVYQIVHHRMVPIASISINYDSMRDGERGQQRDIPVYIVFPSCIDDRDAISTKVGPFCLKQVGKQYFFGCALADNDFSSKEEPSAITIDPHSDI